VTVADIVSLSIVGAFMWLMFAFMVALSMDEHDWTPRSRSLRALAIAFAPLVVVGFMVVLAAVLVASMIRQIWRIIVSPPNKTAEPATAKQF